jgi:hypothetical protein
MPKFTADSHLALMSQQAAEVLRKRRLATLPSGQVAQMPGRAPGAVKPPPSWLQPFDPRAPRPASTMPFDPRVQRPAGTEAPTNWLMPFDPRAPKVMAQQAAVAARGALPAQPAPPGLGGQPFRLRP